MDEASLAIESHFANNALIIIDALAEDDLQTARRLEEDVGPMALQHERRDYVHYVKVNTAADLASLLDDLSNQCKMGLRPILHIESHGDREGGLAIGSASERFSWDRLNTSLRTINRAAKNNLGVVLAACWGLHAIKPLDASQRSPFYFLIGPDHPVEAGYIESVMPTFYEVLLKTNSLDKAMSQIATEFKQFHCEKFFYVMFARYLKQHSMGSGAARRVENLVTEVVKAGAAPNRASLRATRKQAKAHVRSQEKVFQQRADRFLHGRRAVTYQQALAFARNSPSE